MCEVQSLSHFGVQSYEKKSELGEQGSKVYALSPPRDGQTAVARKRAECWQNRSDAFILSVFPVAKKAEKRAVLGVTACGRFQHSVPCGSTQRAVLENPPRRVG